MNGLEATEVQCPYCWEMINFTIDCSVPEQEYIEDCEVCCQPIDLKITINTDGLPTVQTERDN